MMDEQQIEKLARKWLDNTGIDYRPPFLQKLVSLLTRTVRLAKADALEDAAQLCDDEIKACRQNGTSTSLEVEPYGYCSKCLEIEYLSEKFRTNAADLTRAVEGLETRS